MGFYQVDKCIFTGLTVTNVEDGSFEDAIEYLLYLGTRRIFFHLTYEALDWDNENQFFQTNKHIFQGLILNNNWFEDKKTYITIDKLKELLSQKTFPKTPQEKADNLFQKYLGMQGEDGQVVVVDKNYFKELVWKELYFKSYNELLYYTKHLHNQKLIHATFTNEISIADILVSFYITIEGLNYGIKLQSEGDKSNLCFIAMAFDDKTSNIRNAIKEALWETGFKDILIDEQNIDSDRTINDEIIANLKKCRFCVADFSYHSKGVYFESGFALGQGKKVIYTCLDSQFNDAHFDIKPLQHIIYKTAEQLKKDLKNKIEAWII
jgi:hypothetical protein